MARQCQPNVVLMDVRMPRMDAIEATRRLLITVPTCRVLVLTAYDVDEHVIAALQAGASAFILKDTPGDR